jgi:hypothetical protein
MGMFGMSREAYYVVPLGKSWLLTIFPLSGGLILVGPKIISVYVDVQQIIMCCSIIVYCVGEEKFMEFLWLFFLL